MPRHPEIQVARARALRSDASEAEKRLWQQLRGRQIEGLKFRRQYEIGVFIVDLCCDEAKLIVEADGGQHADQAEYDARRTAWLETQGYRVLRFWNNDILQNMDGVLGEVRRVVLERIKVLHFKPTPHPSPLPKGERE